MSQPTLRFLFTAPRYHTNQHFAVKALLDAGHEASFLALKRGQSEVYDALHPTVLRRMSPFWLWQSMRTVKPDAVIVRNPSSTYGLVSVIVATMLGAVVIFYSQTPLHRQLNMWKRVIRTVPAWVVRAKWITPVLGSPDRYPAALNALRYVPFVMEPQTAPDQKQWFRGNATNILCIGKYQRRKNHRLFLQAFARLAGRHSVRATIVGECTTTEHQRELSELKNYQQHLGLIGNICFKKNLPFKDVQDEYWRHDLFVLASRDEPAAVSNLEAMAHSLPVICSNSNGTKCYTRPGENGFIFRTDDVDHLEQCMESIVSNRERLVAMGARSYQLVVSEHAPRRFVQTLLEIATGCS